MAASGDSEKLSLIGLDPAGMGAALEGAGVLPKNVKMRVRQLWNWIYVHGARDFSQMTNLAKDFRTQMEAHFTLARPEVVTEQISNDGTRKWLLRTGPGIEFETVYIPEAQRGTLCVSSQVGCTLNCRFCHTGTQKLVRNLTAAEIVGQLLVARDSLGDWPSTAPGRKVTNVVMMGMGEPLYNFDNVKAALAIVTDGDGLALSRRRVTLSTAGVVPMIERAGAEIGSGLAISLILAVVPDMQASLPGLGRDIFLAQRSFRGAELYAGLIMLGVIGVLINHGLQLAERRLLRWRPGRA